MTEQEFLERTEQAKKYYAQFDINEPDITDWRKWLSTLSKEMAENFYDKGFSYSLKSIPFQAWYLDVIKGIKPTF